MLRRQFVRSLGALTTAVWPSTWRSAGAAGLHPSSGTGTAASSADGYRALFPRMEHDVYLNAAGNSPLAAFSEEGLNRYLDFWRYGNEEGRDEILRSVNSQTRGRFGELVGADEEEISFVSCTKEGEQIVLDSLRPWDDGGNVVTNVFHFSGSLHNYRGHQEAGREVRIVRADDWDIDAERMIEAMDERTKLVAVTLVSNINGRVEDVRALAQAAHERGAYLYADIIQAAGIYPIDLHALDVDFASCAGNKWLFGPHGTGFFYARRSLQGSAFPDRMYPGRVQYYLAPWNPSQSEGLVYTAPTDARRYQNGHPSYLGYAAILSGLDFIAEVGVDKLLAHSLHLNERLLERLHTEAFPCTTPQPLRSPIIAFEKGDRDLIPALIESKLVVSLWPRQIRVSPGIYNNEDDVDLLARVLNEAA